MFYLSVYIYICIVGEDVTGGVEDPASGPPDGWGTISNPTLSQSILFTNDPAIVK